MEIKKLVALPEMIRNEEDTAYVYPEKYQGQIYEHEGAYVLLKGNSPTQMPKELIDGIIAAKLKAFGNDGGGEYDIMADDRAKSFVNKLVEEMMGNSFNNVNRVIDNIQDKLASSIGLEDFQEFRKQIEVSINQLISEGTKIAEDFDPQEINKDLQMVLDRCESLNKRVEVLGNDFASANIDGKSLQPAPIDAQLVQKIIGEELKVVYDNLPEVVNKLIATALQEFTPVTTELTATPAPSKLSLGQLATLKESGYTVQEIKELKAEGLI